MRPHIYTDEEIQALIAEPKLLHPEFYAHMRCRVKRSHKEWDLDITGQAGNRFRVILRLNTRYALDFSAILGYRVVGDSRLFLLRRYNGKSHEHANSIEGPACFFDFHIHTATERYQQRINFTEEHFAEPTMRYVDFEGAIQCLLDDCGFRLPNAVRFNANELPTDGT